MSINTAILLAGGKGGRLGGEVPKQYQCVADRMLVTWALTPLITCCHIDEVIIVAEEKRRKDILADVRRAGLPESKIRDFADPGSNRQRSVWNVWNGMKVAMTHSDRVSTVDPAGDPDTILIHDAARPRLRQSLLDRLYEALHGHDGVMPALYIRDMTYTCTEDGRVDKPLDRDRMVAGQAPELFTWGPYYWANMALLPTIGIEGETEGPDVTMDDIRGSTEPALLAGLDIITIPGDEQNYKITTAKDMEKFREMVEGML